MMGREEAKGIDKFARNIQYSVKHNIRKTETVNGIFVFVPLTHALEPVYAPTNVMFDIE